MAPIEGFWGPPTSTVDWCEENYTVSPYIAEFWNTISNLCMIVYPLVALWQYRALLKDEIKFVLLFLSLSVIGCGSLAFHMTLRYEMQVADELPMIYGTLLMIYILLLQVEPKLETSRVKHSVLQVVLILSAIMHTLIYLYFKTFMLHILAHDIEVIIAIYLNHRLVKLYPECKSRLLHVAFGLYVTGVVLWLIDYNLCHGLQAIRNSPGTIVPSSVTQMHAWWHVFAHFGTYLQMLFSFQSRFLLKKSIRLKPTFNWYVGIVLEEPNKKIEQKLNSKSKIN